MQRRESLILNLTNHPTTDAQIRDGVFDPITEDQ